MVQWVNAVDFITLPNLDDIIVTSWSYPGQRVGSRGMLTRTKQVYANTVARIDFTSGVEGVHPETTLACGL